MSFEAIAWVRPHRPDLHWREDERPRVQKWLTVPTDDRAAAFEAFRKLGFDVMGMTIQPQDEATATAARL